MIQSEGTILHYWPLTETGTSTFSSLTSTSTISIFNGAAGGASGFVDGTSISFDGNNDYGVSSGNIDLTQTSKVVAEGLFYFNSFNGTDDLGFETGTFYGSNGSIHFNPNASAPSNTMVAFLNRNFSGGGDQMNSASFSRPSAANWHHIVIVFDIATTSQEEVAMYVDGVLQSRISKPQSNESTGNFGSNPLYLMSRAGTALFSQGKMQHFALYTDLSQSRIQAHYEAAFGLLSSSTAGTLTSTAQSTSTATLSWTNAFGGIAPITMQLQRSPANAGMWTNVSGANSSPATVTGLTHNTAYDFRVSFTDASSTTAYSNTLSLTTDFQSSTATSTVRLADLWDNLYDNLNAPFQSPFARYVFNTNAAAINVIGTTTIYNSYGAWAQLGVRVDGVNLSPLAFTANGTKNFSVNIGTEGVNKQVEIITGLQSTAGGPTSLGSFVSQVIYPASASFNVLAPTTTNRVLFYGDSISVGGNSTNPVYQAYVPLLRTTYGLNTMLEGWGYRTLYDDASTTGAISSFVSHIASSSPGAIWIAIGTNDYGLNKWSAAAFGSALADTLDAIHTALPTARVFCQTPLVRGSENSTNGSGSNLPNYRTSMINACTSRSDFAYVVDGPSLLSLSDLADGLHPSTSGFVKYANRIAPYLASTSFSVAGPTSGSLDTSTDFTVTLGSNATFIGDELITVSDNGDGGTFTSSLGNSGVSSLTFDPATSTRSFTFTYRPSTVGVKNLSYSNNRSWINAATSTYTVEITSTPTPSVSTGGGGGGSFGGGSSVSSLSSSTPASLPPATANAIIFTRDLTLNAQGTDVYALQRFLNARGHTISRTGAGSPGNESSIFGSLTRQALIRFQTSVGITPATGYFGPLTRAFINKLGATPPPPATVQTTPTAITTPTTYTRDLTLGSTGSDVTALQTYLIQKEYLQPGYATGYFGTLTQSALIKFQQANDIVPALGYFGPKTREVVGR